ncbi:EIF2B1 [Lepeophtheirus salmonis]|uniref:Translation initiation factor eIF2B subunit alpha n=1 Tax=Lepeophtheirus salmonis TaxID=72036 RepID=A0A7R8CZN5_LEPSM|nr:EIF2B1 [Lepeophtheirus salmonis]CAF2977442.1 EIF2B1 [Lepeophtheirus salmonis]
MPGSSKTIQIHPSTKDVGVEFANLLKNESKLSPAIAAIEILNLVLKRSTGVETLQELIDVLKNASNIMKLSESLNFPATSVISGCELYLRFITLAHSALETTQDFNQKLLSFRSKIAHLASSHFTDGSVILVHGCSNTVLETLAKSAEENKRIHAYITEGYDGEGIKMMEKLNALNLDTTLVPDAAMGSYMERVHCVVVGAQGVVESGGIINKLGTYTMALCAMALNKPFYVICESFKFVRLYPLNQRDLPIQFRFNARTIVANDDKSLQNEIPKVDFTPPHLITLLFTDLE